MALADDFYQEQRRSNRRLAEALLKQSTDVSPVQHWTQGAARIAQALTGGYMGYQADQRDKEREDRISALLSGMPGLTVGPGATSAGASADLQEPAAARAPDGMDRSISGGPRPPTAPPITMEPPAAPSPYKLAGMPPPTNANDTFRTPLDAMMPREQGLAALRASMGGQPTAALPPMEGPTPPGAIPVPTQAIRPPAPPAAPQNAPAATPMAGGIDPKMGAYIKVLLAEPGTRQIGLQMLAAEQQRAEARATRAAAEKPTFGKIGVDPTTGADVMGWIDPRRQTTTPTRLPGSQDGPSSIPPVPPGVDPKVWREAHSKAAAAEAMPGTSEGAMKLRKEVQDLPSYKNLAQSAPVYRSMLEAAGRDTRASDVNLIYGMAKLMDPGSVVRESEMSIAQAIATLPQNVQAQIKSQFTSSGRLDPEVRAGIMQEAHSRVNAYRGMFDQDVGMYRGIAQRGRFNEADVIPGFGEFKPFEPPPKAVAGPSNDAIEAELRRRKLIP